MKNSTAILATVALGAVLAIGSASASMARGDGSSDHGRGFGGGPSSNSASAGDHAYGATIPFMANNGASLSTIRASVSAMASAASAKSAASVVATPSALMHPVRFLGSARTRAGLLTIEAMDYCVEA